MNEINITADDLKGKKMMVGTPMFGGQCSRNFTSSMINLNRAAVSYGIGLDHFFISNESLIPRARNYVADHFLRSDCTHLLFVDADIGFSWRDALTLMHFSDEDNDMGIVCGAYPKKVISYEKVAKAAKLGRGDENPFDLAKYSADFVLNTLDNTFNPSAPTEVREAGTGFMMIDRKTLVKFANHYPELSYKPDHLRDNNFDGSREIHAFFDTVIDPKTKRYLSEDYMFCQYAREAGSKIWVCPWMHLTHDGTHTYSGSISEIAAINASLTTDETGNRKHYENKTGNRKQRRAAKAKK